MGFTRRWTYRLLFMGVKREYLGTQYIGNVCLMSELI